jgi:hypothetical protein
LIETQPNVREVMLADGAWHKVEPGTWKPDPSPWRMFRFRSTDGIEFHGLKEAILAVRG